MTERVTVTQRTQIGPETTPGTSVAAGVILPSFKCTPGIEGNWNQVQANGIKFPTSYDPAKEWSTMKWDSDAPSYDELTYIIESILAFLAPSTSDASAKTWVAAPSSTTEDTVKTYTVEHGSAARAHKFTNGIFTDLTLNMDRGKVSASASMIGQQTADGITLTVSPTIVTQVPLLPNTIDVYLDATSAGIGGTKIARLLSSELKIANRFSPFWILDSTKPSFAGTVEMPIQGSFKAKVEADAAGMALLTTYGRVGATAFGRIKSTSTILAGAATAFYGLTVDFAAEVMDKPGDYADQDGVYALEFPFGIVHNAAWGKAITASLVNKLAAL